MLVFVTGSKGIPPTGFSPKPKISFIHDETAIFPTASACQMSLHIPTGINDYQIFKDNLVWGLKGHDGFGNP